MKSFQRILFFVLAIVCVANLGLAQVTNVTINDSTSNISFASGDSITWKISIATGDTSHNAIWLDVNNNGAVDSTDKPLFVFDQVDGGSQQNQKGPADMDNTANGVVTTKLSLGFAPAHWIFVAKDKGVGISRPFTVTPLQNPVATITGTISGPGGSPKQYIVMGAEKSDSSNNDGDRPFWHGITDANGNYSIAVGGNAVLGTPWSVQSGADNKGTFPGGYVLSPDHQSFLLQASVTNVNFTLILGGISSLTLNGSSSGASFTSGDVITWEIHLQPGQTSNDAIWLDVNNNGQADEGIDKPLFFFQQTDGAQNQNDGPGDGDATVNGVITTTIPLGLAPGHWIFTASNSNVQVGVPFTVNAIGSPAATISGTVSGPQGSPKQYLVLQAKPDSGGNDTFWHGITDANGQYTIAVGGSPVLGGTWRVNLANNGNNFGPFLFSPQERVFTLQANVANVNFSFITGTIISGRVMNNSTGLANANGPHTHNALDPMNNNSGQYHATTDQNGYYSMTVPPGKYFMHFTAYHFFDQWWDHKNNGTMDTLFVTNQDTIKFIDASLTMSAVIEGHVSNYGSPVNAVIYLENSEHQQINNTSTQNDGYYYMNVPAGTYYVRFQYDESSMYYDNENQLMVVGTEIKSNINGDFHVGPPPPPVILNVWDVPNDQGKKVFIRWAFNEPGPEILSKAAKTMTGVDKYSIWRRESGGWTFVGEVPARGDSIYTAIVPTLWDSTKVAGMHWSKFQVTAHSTWNLFSINSFPDSGYSLDNLAPIPPGNPTGAALNNDIVLQWGPPKDNDVDRFEIYRSTSADFSIDGMTPIGTTQTLSYTDLGANVATEYFYKIAGVDESGNRGAGSGAVSSKTGHTTGVGAVEELPTVFALSQNYPNPFNPSTTIGYDLPKAAMVTVRVYNTLGQEVATLVQSEQPAGRYAVKFNADNIATGMYIYKITAGDFVAVKKMSLMK